MTLNRTLRPEQAWLMLAALLLLLVAACAAVFTVRVHARAAQTLAQIEPRYARINGMLQNQQQIEQANQALETNFARYVYPENGDASQIGNQALQKVRDLATARDLRVVSSQSQQAKQDTDHPELDRIDINVRIEGEWSALQTLLAELTRQTPAIYLDTMQLTSQGGGIAAANTPLTINGQFDLYVLKVHPVSAAASAPAGAAPTRPRSGTQPEDTL